MARGPATSSTTVRPACIRSDSFFARPPHKWNLREFVAFQYPRFKLRSSPKRWILGAWTGALGKIGTCRNHKCSGNSHHRRAADLLTAYHTTGSENDRASGSDAFERLLMADEKNEENEQSDPSVSVTVNNKVIVNNGTGNNYVHSDQTTSIGTTNSPAEEPSMHLDEEDSREPDVTDEAFEHAYSSFNQDRKWVLPSGDIVEDILYEAFRKRPPPDIRDCILNWTVDVGNRYMKALFQEKDWEAIQAEVKAVPPVPLPFAKELATRFSQVETTDQLRTILDTSPAVDAKDANAFDLRWARRVIEDFLDLFECNALDHLAQYGEHWFDTHVWGPILDKCMLSLRDVILNRADIKSRSYVQRKNRGRVDVSERLRSGPSLDGVFRDRHNKESEFGLLECSPLQSGGEYSTKWIGDVKKVQKPMRDMLGQLAIQANYDRRVVDHLQVFAFCTSALTIQVSHMTQPKGHVFLLRADRSVSLPQNIQQFPRLLMVISLIVQTKRAMARSIEAFRDGTSRKDKQALIDEMLNVGGLHGSHGTVLPETADTP